jgi:hypothetical protein
LAGPVDAQLLVREHLGAGNVVDLDKTVVALQVGAGVLQEHTRTAEVPVQERRSIKIPRAATQPQPVVARDYARDIPVMRRQKLPHAAAGADEKLFSHPPLKGASAAPPTSVAAAAALGRSSKNEFNHRVMFMRQGHFRGESAATEVHLLPLPLVPEGIGRSAQRESRIS